MILLKAIIHRFIPVSLCKRLKRFHIQLQNQKKSTERVFTEIYENNSWGGSRGEYNSGSGSTHEHIVSPYISKNNEKETSKGFLGLKYVKLGCGDFRVGRQLLPLCSDYIGVDIVESLIRRNREQFGNPTTRFIHLDIVADELPDGDVCFVRQVLQHLSNQQITKILPKLKKYNWVFITEHYPEDNVKVVRPNLDKVHGYDIRTYKQSGVYLSEPPFAIPRQAISNILAVPSNKPGSKNSTGIIRTFLYKPTEYPQL